MATAAPPVPTIHGLSTATPVLQMLVLPIRLSPPQEHVLTATQVQRLMQSGELASQPQLLLQCAMIENKCHLMVDTVWHAQATLGHKTETDALLISVTQTKS